MLFAASAANVKSIINLRPFVRIPDVLASYKLMKSLNPEVVVPGHGAVSTTKIFDEYEAFYTLLMKRVGEMAATQALSALSTIAAWRGTVLNHSNPILETELPIDGSRFEGIWS